MILNEFEVVPDALKQGIATQARRPCLHELFPMVRVDLQILPKIEGKLKQLVTSGKDFSHFKICLEKIIHRELLLTYEVSNQIFLGLPLDRLTPAFCSRSQRRPLSKPS